MSDSQDYFEELRKEKEGKRQVLMTDTELKEAEKFLTWYRRAYEDKVNLGVVKKWEDINKYWETLKYQMMKQTQLLIQT